MGIITFDQAATMDAPKIWYGTVTSHSSSSITISDSAGDSGIYYGSFSYNNFGLTGGTVTGYDSYNNYALEYTARNFSLNALTLDSYLNSGNATAVDQYVLSGNDTFYQSPGNDSINGYGGINTVVYNGNLSNFTITKSSSGYIVTDNTGANGTDSITNIQILKFSDQSVTLDGKTVPITSFTTQSTIALPAANTAVSGSGLDILNMGSQLSSAYTMTSNGDGSFDLVTAGSTNHIAGVLQVQFADKTMTIAPTGSLSEETALLYQAALDRQPDANGLAYWDRVVTTEPNTLTVNSASGAYSGIISIASGFTGSTEFHAKYGTSLTPTQFVTQLYSNVLDRLPDSGGLGYWVSQINGGASREQILAGFAASTEAISNATVGYIGQSGPHHAW